MNINQQVGSIPPCGNTNCVDPPSSWLDWAKLKGNGFLWRVCQIATTTRMLVSAGRVRTFLRFGGAVGDDLLCTVPLHALAASLGKPVGMISNYPDLFRNNPDVACVLPHRPWNDEFLRRFFGFKFIHPYYCDHHDWANDQDSVPDEHILAAMSRRAGASGRVELRPRVFLTPDEMQAGMIAPRQLAIQTGCAGALWPMKNKEWLPERFLEVGETLQKRFALVQLGSPTDTKIPGALDLRGKTALRQAAAVLSQSIVFIGLVGFLMHLARAVDCRSVIVYGGREKPSQTGYPCNINLAADVPCAPCWRQNNCDHARECMLSITSADVIAAVDQAVHLHGQPLECEEAVL